MTRVLGFDPTHRRGDARVPPTAVAYPGLRGTTRTLVRLTGPAQAIDQPARRRAPSLSGSPASARSAGPRAGARGSHSTCRGRAPRSSPPRWPPRSRSPGPPRSVSGSRRAAGDPVRQGLRRGPGRARHPAGPARGAVRVAGARAGRVVTVALPAIDYSFSAGHRLRLVLTTTDFGYATPPAPAVTRSRSPGRARGARRPGARAVPGRAARMGLGGAAVRAGRAALILAAGARRRGAGGPGADGCSPTSRWRSPGWSSGISDGHLAVDGLSLRVERGQILGLLGPNGAGKTTTLRALMGLLHPDEGTITIFGQRVHPAPGAVPARLVRGGARVPAAPVRPGQPGAVLAGHRAAPLDGRHLDEVLALAGLGTAIDRPVRSYSRGCASGWPSPRPCSACRTCWCSTSR